MTFFAKRKRKNDESSPFPAWLIVLVALGIVIVAVILFRPASRSSTTASDVNQPSGNIELTATAIIQEATAMAQGTPQPVASDLDPFELTATYIVQQVTAIAQGTPQPGS
jgi:hypothetical protein